MSDVSRSVTTAFEEITNVTTSAASKANYRWAKGGLLLAMADAIAAWLASAVVTFGHALLSGSTALLHDQKTYFSVVGILVINGSMGLYDTATIDPVERFRRRTLAALLLPWLTLAAVAATRPPTVGDIADLLLMAILIIPVGLFGESRLRRALPAAWNATTLVVGSPEAAARLTKHFEARPEFGLRPIGFISDIGNSPNDPSATLPWLGPMRELERLAAGVDVVVVVASPDALLPSPTQLPVRRVVVVPEMDSEVAPWLLVRHLGTAAGLEYLNLLHSRFSRWAKRAFELCVAVPALIVSLPLIGFLALAIKIASPGPAFYIQQRVGWKGNVISIPKLRSMHIDAEARLEHILASDDDARREWERHMKLSHDPRILPFIGRFVRRTSFDELPQLWAVVRGDLSLIGPRPFPRYHTDRFTPAFQALRASVKPGLTGLWQVSQRSDADLREQETIDTFYIRNWSLWLDAYIVIHTIPAMFAGHGAR